MNKIEKKISIYLASGWFTENTKAILGALEKAISENPNISLYSPRRDGIMLPPDQKHDTELRESIFKENINHILSADVVVANIDSRDSYNDPGTIYEIGYAMAKNIPVVGFSLSKENIEERFKCIIQGFDCIVHSIGDLLLCIETYRKYQPVRKNKVLFVGAGNESVDNKLASYIIDNGYNIRWVNDEHDQVYSKIDEIFEDVDFMIAVIDDRKTLVSWMIGQAYARNVPVITYSDFNWGINVMLLISVLTHLRGADELQRFLQQVKREGLESIQKLDISQLTSM